MSQAVWTGSISFGLVNIPVKLYPATEPKDVRFHLYDRRTGKRLRYERVTRDTDAPTFEPLNPSTHPTEEPWSAAWEGITRYLPHYLGPQVSPEKPLLSDGTDPSINPRDVEISLAAERDSLQMARTEGVTAVVLQHWTAAEVKRGHSAQGHDEILQVARASGVPVHQDSEKLRALLAAGRNPFFDDIHLNPLGQEALAQALLEILRQDAPNIVPPSAH